VTLTDRDRKLVMFIVPIVLVLAYWFLLLSPKREDAAEAGKQLAAAEKARDQAVDLAERQAKAKETFETDYTEIVRLGKAIPPTVDMASLLVQIDSAAKGTDIDFDKITAGERVSSATGETITGGQAAQSTQPQSGAGKAAAAANDAKAKTEGQAKASDSASSGSGSGTATQPAGASTPAAGGASSGAPAGLDVVPLQLSFTGTFFDLADFLHRLKRYVYVRGDAVQVRGRLMRIETLKLTPKAGAKLGAELTASVYLSPKTQGATAGATPQGPAQTTPASGGQPTPAPTKAAVTR
jgi:hypothetical protein